MADEDVPTGGRGSAVAEVLGDRSSDPFGKRQDPRPSRLSALDPQGGRTPINLFKVECAHFADVQAQVDLTERHGVIAAARRGRSVEAGQEEPELVIGHRSREVVQSPARDGRDGSHQRRFALAVELKEPQEAAQGTGRGLCRAAMRSVGVSRDEGHQVLGADRPPHHGAVRELMPEEFAGVSNPIGAAGLGQAAGVPQVAPIVLKSRIDGIGW